MLKFIARRLLYGILVLIGVVIVVFYLFHVLPGDPTRAMGDHISEETRQRIKDDLGLDRSVAVRLAWYLNDLSVISVHSDTPKHAKQYSYAKIVSIADWALVIKYPYLQRSYISQKKVSEILLGGIIGTFWLTLSALVIATFFGVIFGIIAALNQHKFIDHTLITVSVVGISTPSFISAIFLGLLFADLLHDYTGLTLTGQLFELNLYTGKKELILKNLILPAITLGIRPLAIITQLTRSSMLTVMNQDFIVTAHAKGVSYVKIVLVHALKNALNPVVTAASGWLATLMAGAFFVEYIFSYRGIGLATMQAVQDRDLPIVMGAIITVAVVFIVVNLLVDILYSILDPRVKLA